MRRPALLLRRTRWLAAGVAVSLACTPAAAQTTPTPEAPAEAATEARSHFDRGVTFYDEADYAAALVEFRRAYALAPAWQVLFNVGQSSFQLHDYAGALTALQRFLDQGGDRVPAERRALVDREIADLSNRVGHAAITSNATGATVMVDGEVVGVTPLAEPLLVSVGLRKIALVRQGERVEQEVSVAGGETAHVQLDYAAPPPPASVEPAPVPPAPPVVRPPIARSPTPNLAPAVVALGLGLAGAAVGTVFGGLALHDKAILDGECNGKACRPGSHDDIVGVSRDATVSTVGFAVMGVGLAAGVVLWIVENGAARTVQGRTPAAPGSAVQWGPGFARGTF